MKIETRENLKIVRETPGCLWFAGVFLMLVSGMLLFGTVGGFSNWSFVPQWQLAIATVIAAGGFLGGLWMTTGSPVTSLQIDRVEETVALNRRGMFKRTSDVFRFEEIRRFCLIEDSPAQDDRAWSLGIELANDRLIAVTSLPLHDELHQGRIVAELNDFARFFPPEDDMILESKDEANEQMS